MKRIHLFEFEDFHWFPNWIRVCMTRYIATMHRLLGTKDQLADLLSKALQHSSTNHVLDMCSGSGGPMIDTVQQLKMEKGLDIKLTLSDLYPNQQAAKRINSGGDSTISYLTSPLDATAVDRNQTGVRTMICSMHHMKPEIAKGILTLS